MVVRHAPFKGSGRLYEDYYCAQAGHGLPVFVGGYRGRGLGSLLGGIGRAIVPLLKSGGKHLLKEGAKTGMQVAQDVLSGQSIKGAIKQRARETGKRLFQQAVGRVTGGLPPGEPANKRIKSSTPRVRGQNVAAGRRKKRRKKNTADIFD